MKNKITFTLIAITLAASAFARSQAMVQSQAQDFSVTAKGTRDGLVLWVKERGSGRLLFNKVINRVAFNGDLNVARRAALAVTSQNSGPNMPIASGVFVITRDTLSSGIYEATVHRARPDEVTLVAPPQTPSAAPPTPTATVERDPIKSFNELVTRFPKGNIKKLSDYSCDIVGDVTFDVKKTDSLINPVIGIIDFTSKETIPNFSELRKTHGPNITIHRQMQMVFHWQGDHWKFERLLDLKNGDFTDSDVGEAMSEFLKSVQ